MKNSFVSHAKGFGCITFESEASVLKATSERFQLIDGTRVEVKEYIKKKYVFCHIFLFQVKENMKSFVNARSVTYL